MRHTASERARHGGRERCWDGPRRRLDSLRLQQLGDELAKHDRLAIGDEVGLAGAALVGREHQPLDHVVDVGRVRELPAAADPGEAPRPHGVGDRREQGRVAGAPDEPRPQDDGLEALAAGTAHRLLGPRLGRRVGRLRVGPQRGGLVDPDQWLAGNQGRLGPTVDEPAHTGASGAGERVLGPGDVAGDEVLPRSPLAEVGGQVKGGLTSVGAGGDRIDVRQVAADRLGAELLDHGGRGIRARQGADPAPVLHQPPHEVSADEP